MTIFILIFFCFFIKLRTHEKTLKFFFEKNYILIKRRVFSGV
jgi:hypothetical protein